MAVVFFMFVSALGRCSPGHLSRWAGAFPPGLAPFSLDWRLSPWTGTFVAICASMALCEVSRGCAFAKLTASSNTTDDGAFAHRWHSRAMVQLVKRSEHLRVETILGRLMPHPAVVNTLELASEADTQVSNLYRVTALFHYL